MTQNPELGEMGIPLSCGKPLCSPGDHHPLCKLATPVAAPQPQTTAQEPFGYFKAEPFGWRDCAETDEGAIALYDAPQPQADAPELLEFAKEWLSRRGDDDNYMAAKCRAAIAKATGAASSAAQPVEGGEHD